MGHRNELYMLVIFIEIKNFAQNFKYERWKGGGGREKNICMYVLIYVCMYVCVHTQNFLSADDKMRISCEGS